MTTQSQSQGEVNFKLVLFLSKLTLMLEARRGIVLRPLRIPKVQQLQKLYGPSMFAVKAKINGVIYNQSSSIVFETSSY